MNLFIILQYCVAAILVSFTIWFCIEILKLGFTSKKKDKKK